MDLTFGLSSGVTHHSMKRALILGSGYSGKVLHTLLKSLKYDVICTRRSPGDSDVVFDLNRSETWSDLPSVDATFWMFPCEPKDLVEKFLSEKGPSLGRVVCVGTTSSYLVSHEGAVVIETSPIHREEPRVQGELVALRHGAIIVRSAGIYGPARDPRRWVIEGRVSPSPKLVNFIHVEDLAAILVAVSERGRPGSVYLAADGRPQRWDELIAQWCSEFKIVLPEIDSKSRPATRGPGLRVSKRIDSQGTLSELGVTLLFPDVQSGVRSLQ
jgi:hypothetical protein